MGKWHLENPASPEAGGFESSTWFVSNGPHYDRKVTEAGKQRVAPGFIEEYLADRAIAFLDDAARGSAPFFLHLCTQLPHMNPQFDWQPRPETLRLYDGAPLRVPANWRDDLRGKPPYLAEGRHRQQAQSYGYGAEAGMRKHLARYYAAITDLDRALGRVFAALDRLGVRDNTYVVLLGDNGWFIGEHGFTSKVLPYEESIRVPLAIAGPGLRAGVRGDMVLNADVAPTLLELAGIEAPGEHARAQHAGAARRPQDAVAHFHVLRGARTHARKLAAGGHPGRALEIRADVRFERPRPARIRGTLRPEERSRRTAQPGILGGARRHAPTARNGTGKTAEIDSDMNRRNLLKTLAAPVAAAANAQTFLPGIPNVGVKADSGPRRTESAVGALMPWADVLWAVTYVSSRGHNSGSGTGLYEIDDRLRIRQRHVSNGVYANRLVHTESNQVFIGPYAIDMAGNIRIIDDLVDVRLTATMRHLTDPANRVYVLSMEGPFYEVDVSTLKATLIADLKEVFAIKPPPHFKGGHTGQGRVVVANNTYTAGTKPKASSRNGTASAGTSSCASRSWKPPAGRTWARWCSPPDGTRPRPFSWRSSTASGSATVCRKPATHGTSTGRPSGRASAKWRRSAS